MTRSNAIGWAAVGGVLVGIGVMAAANGDISVLVLGACISFVSVTIAGVMPA